MYYALKHALKVAVARAFNLHVSVPPVRTMLKLEVDTELMLRYLGKVLPKDAVFVEVGAGAHGNYESFKAFLDLDPANCHFIEACPENFEVLAKRYPDCHCHNLAIAAENGTASFYVYNEPTELGSSRGNTINRAAAIDKFGDGNFSEIQVPTRDLSTFFEETGLENVNFLFLNCEGAEYIIFRGNLDFLDRVDFLWLDLHGRCKTFQDLKEEKLRIYDLLIDKGFTKVGGHGREVIEDASYHLTFLWER